MLFWKSAFSHHFDLSLFEYSHHEARIWTGLLIFYMYLASINVCCFVVASLTNVVSSSTSLLQLAGRSVHLLLSPSTLLARTWAYSRTSEIMDF